MTPLFALNQPLQSILWPKHNKLIKEILLVVLGVFLLALSSRLYVPLKPVPLTFQSSMVIFLGMVYGMRLGMFTVLAFILAGCLGLPVFVHSYSGTSLFLDPTVGYILGFFPAVIISSYLAQAGWARNTSTTFVAACLGVSVIFVLGYLALAKFVGWQQAFVLGVAPFMITEPMKLLAISLVIPRFWRAS